MPHPPPKAVLYTHFFAFAHIFINLMLLIINEMGKAYVFFIFTGETG